jgi:urease accessory protein
VRRLPVLLIAIPVAVAQPALAHTPIEGVGGFYGGMLHPLLVPAHIMALLGLGLLIGQQAPRCRPVLLALFAAALTAGVAAIVGALAAENADVAVLATAVASGALVALARPLPLLLSAAPALVLGAALAFDSVPQDISMRSTLLALAGTAATAFIIAMLIADATGALRRDWQRIGVRVLGSWTAASAVLVLALRLTR